MEIADSVRKKLDILVVADPHTQSGKARKARQYGKRVIHELIFLADARGYRRLIIG